MSFPPTLLIVPGLRDHVPDHWQTLLAKKLSPGRVVCSVSPLGRVDLSCAKRVAAIQQALQAIYGPVIVAAHSAGVISLEGKMVDRPHLVQARRILSI